MLGRWVGLLLLCCALPALAQDNRDIDAVSRSVVRVVVVAGGVEGSDVGMGSGVAITPNRILTNAHVVESAVTGEGFVGIVPSEGTRRYEGKVVAYRADLDLAVIDIGSGRIPPATLFSGVMSDGAQVAALGYPYGVDRALAGGMTTVVTPQSPVKSLGHVAGRRSNAQFDTVLHDAAIGRGNSGGPLVDACGRVVGINSFLSISEGIDSTFAFAISVRELLPFLQKAGVAAAIVGTPCLSDSEAGARDAALVKADEAAAALEAHKGDADVTKAAQEKMTIRDQISGERENGMAIAAVLLVVGALALAGAGVAQMEKRNRIAIGAVVVGIALILAAVIVYLGRPKLTDVEDRYARLHPVVAKISDTGVSAAGSNICTFVADRSRVTVSKTDDVPLDWQDDGCVNGKTQYGANAGTWSRSFVPNTEPTVTVQTFDPAKRRYTVERFLMAADAMDKARAVRAQYPAKGCQTDPGARQSVSEMQTAIRQTLPPSPNERLVFDCRAVAKL
ncbi:S1C family serine protease [Sphingomonas sp.]|uniref:S1C family serine protease n=1 Tax=Sphingomonas sp. TaxID=28214 RepID=UPI0025FAC942|nr:serine protease [Sphingomonas sp.]